MEINKEQYLKRFKVESLGTLFGPDWGKLKEGRCPLCFNKLKPMLNKPIYYCQSKKHKKFIISKNKVL
jgi:hypothetical protein